MAKTEAEVKADKEFSQFLIMNSQMEYSSSIHAEFLQKVKNLKRFPLLDDSKKNHEMMKAVAKLLSEMIQHTFKERDELHTSLELTLKFLSYNSQLPVEYSSKQGLVLFKSTKIAAIGADFDAKVYDKELNGLALKILGLILRSRVSVDLSTIMFRNDEEVLVEAQERIQKSDFTHTWDHFTQMFSDLRKGQLFNRD